MNDSEKRTFGFHLCVGIIFQFLDNLQYACGLKNDPALTSNPKAHFKAASRKVAPFHRGQMKGLVLFTSLLVFGCSQEPPVEKVASAPQTPAPVYDGTIVALGNSLTAGLGLPENQPIQRSSPAGCRPTGTTIGWSMPESAEKPAAVHLHASIGSSPV